LKRDVLGNHLHKRETSVESTTYGNTASLSLTVDSQQIGGNAAAAKTVIHELSDLDPAKLHMTVPQDFRRNSEIPGIPVLHYFDLPRSDIQIGPCFKYTRPLRTIFDLIEAGATEPTCIRQALQQAIERGLVARQQLRSVRCSEEARKVIEDVLRRAA
jgi:hypothetical protein